MPWFEIAIFLLIPLIIHLFKFKLSGLGLAPETVIAVDDQKPEIRWIEEEQLPRWAKKIIAKHFASFVQAGFKHVGYLEVKHRIVSMYDCYFETDGSMIAEISISKVSLLPASTTIAAKSLLSDGTVVETTHNKKLPHSIATMANEQYFHLTCAGTKDTATLRERHRQEVDGLTNESEKTIVPIDADLIPELVEYSLNLADQYLHREGVLPSKPAEFFVVNGQ